MAPSRLLSLLVSRADARPGCATGVVRAVVRELVRDRPDLSSPALDALLVGGRRATGEVGTAAHVPAEDA